ncbi:hypothetical protein BGX30_004513, partial [Mortierella sp. GBA39]
MIPPFTHVKGVQPPISAPVVHATPPAQGNDCVNSQETHTLMSITQPESSVMVTLGWYQTRAQSRALDDYKRAREMVDRQWTAQDLNTMTLKQSAAHKEAKSNLTAAIEQVNGKGKTRSCVRPAPPSLPPRRPPTLLASIEIRVLHRPATWFGMRTLPIDQSPE